MKVAAGRQDDQDHPDHRGRARRPPRTTARWSSARSYEVTRMNGETVGFGGEYDIKDVPHAMRLSTSGTFIHGNYWARPAPSATPTPATAASACATSRAAATRQRPAAWFYDQLDHRRRGRSSRTPRTRRSPRTTASTAGTCPGRSGPSSRKSSRRQSPTAVIPEVRRPVTGRTGPRCRRCRAAPRLTCLV